MTNPHGIAAVVLAAGASARMGRNKLLLELDGETLVRRSVLVAGDAGLDPVVVVTGHARETIERELQGLGCLCVFNADHARGIQTSVAAGVAALDPACDAAVVMLADMPFVSAEMLGTLASAYRGRNPAPDLVVSRYGGDVDAPPILYDRALFGEMVRATAGCGRAVVRRHRDRAVHVDWPADRLRDIDYPADYESVRRQRTGAGS